MKKIMISLVAATSLVFGTGCGGDVCDDADDAYETAIEKTEDCPTTNTFLKAFAPSDSDVDECKEDLDNCSDSDQDKLQDAYDCISDLPECEEDEEAEWGDRFEACGEKLEGVSEACVGD